MPIISALRRLTQEARLSQKAKFIQPRILLISFPIVSVHNFYFIMLKAALQLALDF
jgi:hypothetical protein